MIQFISKIWHIYTQSMLLIVTNRVYTHDVGTLHPLACVIIDTFGNLFLMLQHRLS